MTSTNRRISDGAQLRDYDELQATLLPTASPIAPSAPLEEDLPTATVTAVSGGGGRRSPVPGGCRRQTWHPSDPIAEAPVVPRTRDSWHPAIAEAPVVPPFPTENRYKDDESGRRLSFAQQQGRQASYAERITVMANNRRVSAYNNQIRLDVDRANEVARLENHRERHLINPTIATPKPSTDNAAATATTGPKEEAYFPKPRVGTGYQVKEYNMDEVDNDYSYDISEYKSDYD